MSADLDGEIEAPVLSEVELALLWMEGDGNALARVQPADPPRIGNAAVWCAMYMDMDLAQAYLLRVAHGSTHEVRYLAVLYETCSDRLVTEYWPPSIPWWPEPDREALVAGQHWFVDWVRARR